MGNKIVESNLSSEAFDFDIGSIDLNTRDGFLRIFDLLEKVIMAFGYCSMKSLLEAILLKGALLKMSTGEYGDDNLYTMRKVESTIGRVQAPLFDGITKDMTSRERLRSYELDRYNLFLCNRLSDRDHTNAINMLLQRSNMAEDVACKTLQEHIQRVGLAMEKYEDEYTKDRLVAAGFDPETLVPESEQITENLQVGNLPATAGPTSLRELIELDNRAHAQEQEQEEKQEEKQEQEEKQGEKQEEKKQEKKTLAESIDLYNSTHPVEAQVSLEMSGEQFRLSTIGGNGSFIAAMDDICVLKQKETRTQDKNSDISDDTMRNQYPEYCEDDEYKVANENEDMSEEAEAEEAEQKKQEEKEKSGKSRNKKSGNHKKSTKSKNNKKSKHKTTKRVWNTIALIMVDGKEYFIRTNSKKKAIAQLLVQIIDKGLVGKPFAFFADGDQNIRDIVTKYLGFCHPVIILDWYHLCKKTREYISMAFNGTIEEKRKLRARITSMLWAGNVDAAMSFVKNLDPELIKNQEKYEGFLHYLEDKKPYIPCYELRFLLGLGNSSNMVEKANDIIVAQRQKSKGKSWSWNGSGALAQIKVAEMNHGIETWLRTHTLPHDLVPCPVKEAKAA